MSAPMIRALLAGTKTQTRRAMRVQPPQHTVAVGRWQDPPGFDDAWWAFVREGAVETDHPFGGAEIHGEPWRCHYGQPGDKLWVRESLYLHRHAGARGGWLYRADNAQVELHKDDPRVLEMIAWAHHKESDHCPSIHMPRWASRITLDVTEVRVQRLQDISEADAIAEGAEPMHWADLIDSNAADLIDWPLKEQAHPYRNGYAMLWESINGAGSWDANPWVWVVEFKRIRP